MGVTVLDNDTVPLGVGITYNLKQGISSEIEDMEAEYDNIETIHAIKGALERAGCNVTMIEADMGMFDKLRRDRPDIVFNIAEGVCGRGREAQVPAILNFFKIPFTGSDETTLCMSLDKALTKRFLTTYNVKTPEYRLVKSIEDIASWDIDFPLIVKPNAEGSSKGISDLAVVKDARGLEKALDRNIKMYGQPMLVEEYIKGREFTVGIVGNGDDTVIFSPLEIIYRSNELEHSVYSYNVKKNFQEYVELKCPADLEKSMERDMKRTAGEIYRALECKDFSRIDFRLSEEGALYFIEINPLPGLAPGYSDYPILAEACGVEYDSLVKMVLNSALKRHGMQTVK